MSAVAITPELVQALRQVLDAEGDRVLEMPSALRSRLTSSVGDRAAELAGPIHLLSGAADEHLPSALLAAAPVGEVQLHHLAAGLAAGRGWTPEAARAVVDVWAAALGAASAGVVLVGFDGWPAAGADLPAPPAEQPDGGRAEIEDDAAEATVLPEAARTVLPSGGLDDPLATVLPQLSSVVVPEKAVEPHPPAEPHQGTPEAAPAAGIPIAWPVSAPKKLARAIACDPGALGAYEAFHPRDPRIRLYAAAGLLVTAIVAYLAFQVFFAPVLIVVLVVWKVVPSGTLVVDDVGGRFYRTLKPGAAPEASFTWAEARFTTGVHGRIDAPAGAVWTALRAAPLNAAIGSRAGATAARAGNVEGRS